MGFFMWKYEKGKKVEEISQDERNKIREEERRKIMKEMKKDATVFAGVCNVRGNWRM